MTVPLAATSGWTIGGVLVGLSAVLVALFKDEFWHALYAPRLDVHLTGHTPQTAVVVLVVRNTSQRVPAESVTVRVTQVEPHPFEHVIGTKQMDHVRDADVLLPRVSGETAFGLSPGSAARVPLMTYRDAYEDGNAAIVELPWAEPEVAGRDERLLLVLPSVDDREYWVETHPDLVDLWPSPAMIRLEVAAANVPAKLYTVKLRRDPDRPPLSRAPMVQLVGSGAFSVELWPGHAARNRAPHGSSMRMAGVATELGTEESGSECRAESIAQIFRDRLRDRLSPDGGPGRAVGALLVSHAAGGEATARDAMALADMAARRWLFYTLHDADAGDGLFASVAVCLRDAAVVSDQATARAVATYAQQAIRIVKADPVTEIFALEPIADHVLSALTAAEERDWKKTAQRAADALYERRRHGTAYIVGEARMALARIRESDETTPDTDAH